MNSLTFDTRIKPDHLLHLPDDLPVGTPVRVTIEPLTPAALADQISFEEFLRHRLQRPAGVRPVTLDDMEEAIIRGALDGNL